MEEPIADEVIDNFVELTKHAIDMARTVGCSVDEGMRIIMTTYQAIQKVNYANAKVGRGPVEHKEPEKKEVTVVKNIKNILTLVPVPGKH
ncbi:MAG: hypothetical protein E6R03_01840 [Hyphomicrobiaceae bacterium]|nr:MAG: hypothetical protein E6R03_01840 [Hyphomicrobiaceae bacterium]